MPGARLGIVVEIDPVNRNRDFLAGPDVRRTGTTGRSTVSVEEGHLLFLPVLVERFQRMVRLLGSDLLAYRFHGIGGLAAGDLQQCAEAGGVLGLALLQPHGQQRQQMLDISQAFAGDHVFTGRQILQIQRDVIRQFLHADGEAGFLVLGHQVDHGLPAIARLAMNVFEQQHGQVATALEQLGIGFLCVQQLGGGYAFEQCRQSLALCRADFTGRHDGIPQFAGCPCTSAHG